MRQTSTETILSVRDIEKVKNTHTQTHQTSNQRPRFRSLPRGGEKKGEKAEKKKGKFSNAKKTLTGRRRRRSSQKCPKLITISTCRIDCFSRVRGGRTGFFLFRSLSRARASLPSRSHARSLASFFAPRSSSLPLRRPRSQPRGNFCEFPN